MIVPKKAVAFSSCSPSWEPRFSFTSPSRARRRKFPRATISVPSPPRPRPRPMAPTACRCRKQFRIPTRPRCRPARRFASWPGLPGPRRRRLKRKPTPSRPPPAARLADHRQRHGELSPRFAAGSGLRLAARCLPVSARDFSGLDPARDLADATPVSRQCSAQHRGLYRGRTDQGGPG